MLQAINEFINFLKNLLYQLLLQANINNLLWTFWIMIPLTCETRKEKYFISGEQFPTFFKPASWSV